MPVNHFPFANNDLELYIPELNTIFVYEVYDDYSCMCAVRMGANWYKQRILLRDIMPLCGQPTVDERRKLFELMQNLLSFRNVLICNVCYGNGGTLIADVEVAGLHINAEINAYIGVINRAIQKRYAESTRGKMTMWLKNMVCSMKRRLKTLMTRRPKKKH